MYETYGFDMYVIPAWLLLDSVIFILELVSGKGVS